MTRQQQPLEFMLPDDVREQKRFKREMRAYWFRMIESIEQLDESLTPGERRRAMAFVKRWLESKHADWKGIGTVRQKWLADDWGISRQTIANYLRWAKSLGAIDWTVSTDGGRIPRTTIEFTYGELARRLGWPKSPDLAPEQSQTVDEQSQTVDEQSQTVDEQSQTVGQYPLSCPSSCPTSTPVEWQAAADALRKCNVTFAAAFVAEAQQLAKSPAEVIDAANVYLLNRTKLDSPGALFVWLRHGEWPADGIRTAGHSQRVQQLSAESQAHLQRELKRTRRFKQLRADGLAIEDIESVLQTEGIA